MINLKQLLKKFIHLCTSSLLLLSGFIPILALFPVQSVSAVTQTGVGILTQGSSWDTGHHTYSGQQNQATNYTIGGNDSPSIVGNWLNLVNDNQNKIGFATFNGAVSTASTFSLKATIKIDTTLIIGLGGNFENGGDALGFILTPSSNSQLQANIPNATGPNLGINGLSNTYFLGRDLYFNDDAMYDGNGSLFGWTAGGGNVMAIRNTTQSGMLNPANYPAGTTTNTTTGQAWMQAPDDNYALGLDTGIPGEVQEPISMSWTPDTTNSAPTGFNSGTLTLNLIAQTTNNGGLLGSSSVNGGLSGYTLTTHCNLQNSMSIGFVGGTGGNYSEMSVSLDSATGTINRGEQTTTVNYVNANTGASLVGWSPTTIAANVNDTLNVLAPGNTATSSPATSTSTTGTYSYVAPTAPAGYSFSSANSVTVQNYQSGGVNPNVINIEYAPNTQTASFTPWYIGGTPGTSNSITNTMANVTYALPSTSPSSPGLASALPVIANTSGLTDSIAPVPLVVVPTGYSILEVIGPNNQVYPSLGTALTANPLTDSSATVASGTPNNFAVILAPTSQTANFSYQYASGTPGYNGTAAGTGYSVPTLPSSITQSGQTGTVIANPGLSQLPAGYVASAVIAPDNSSNSLAGNADLTGALAKFPYMYYQNAPSTFGLQSNFQILVSAINQTGTVSFVWDSNTPGYNGNAGQLQASLPSQINLSGETGSAISFNPVIPTGYAIDTVVGPDGNTYTDSTTAGMNALQAAQAANPYFTDSSQRMNNFTIKLKAVQQTVTLQVNVDQSVSPIPDGGIPTTPNPQVVALGLTGARISSNDVQTGQDWLDGWITSHAGWQIVQYTDPLDNNYIDANMSLQEAVTGAGGYILGGNNTYEVSVTYSGSISLQVPSSVDFGSHTISSSNQTYTGNLNEPVTVSDTRGSDASPWTVTVAETSPITSSNGGISLEGDLEYNNQVLSTAPTQIMTTSQAEGGTTVILDAGSSPFRLNVPVDSQLATSYQGVLTWTLIVAP
ncbi:beta strand repeat-containing protein [Lactococcus nasutitermitis]|uniref:Beta strand repeat-containing protein n=1 Tax=Lactococcus nasutitermitis TaxID=1652957 RepID=A0ABV9JE71_9LACT|nr:WxL domain-containing protein [Lactococcus nasutitermitis]